MELNFFQIGACPALNVPNLIASPDVCSSDFVVMWQECALQCQSGSQFTGMKQFWLEKTLLDHS